MICENCSRASSHSPTLMVSSVEKNLSEIIELKAIASRKRRELETKTKFLISDKPKASENAKKSVLSMQSEIQSIKSKLDESNLVLLENTLNLSACYHRLEKLRLKKDILVHNTENQRLVLESFRMHLNNASDVIIVLRLTRVVELLKSMKIVIPAFNLQSDDLYNFESKRIKSRGLGYICGLPLPSFAYGQEVNLFLPTEILSTVLSSICHVLDALSTILNIPLLHPSYPFETEESFITSAGKQLTPLPLYRIMNKETRYQPKWKSIIKSYIDYQKYKSATNITTNTFTTVIEDKKNIPSFPQSYTSSSSSSINNISIKNKVSNMSETDKKIQYGLNLLQANITDMCRKLGLNSIQLFESTSMIYNLYMIQLQCEDLLSIALQKQSQQSKSQQGNHTNTEKEDETTKEKEGNEVIITDSTTTTSNNTNNNYNNNSNNDFNDDNNDGKFNNYVFLDSLKVLDQLISKNENQFIHFSFNSSDTIIQKSLSHKYHTNRTQLMLNY